MKTSMFKRVLTIALIFGIIAGAGLFTAESAMAQAPSGGTPAADAANWVVAITYQNTGTDATGVKAVIRRLSLTRATARVTWPQAPPIPSTSATSICPTVSGATL